MYDIAIANNPVSPLASCLSFWEAGTPALKSKNTGSLVQSASSMYSRIHTYMHVVWRAGNESLETVRQAM